MVWTNSDGIAAAVDLGQDGDASTKQAIAGKVIQLSSAAALLDEINDDAMQPDVTIL
jgi:hypothetical protein